MQKSPAGNHRQKVRLVGNQDVFILIEHLLDKWNFRLTFQFAIVKDAGAGSIGRLGIYAPALFVDNLTSGHSRSPRFDINLGILFAEEVEDSLPRTSRQPTLAGSHSGNDLKT